MISSYDIQTNILKHVITDTAITVAFIDSGMVEYSRDRSSLF